VSRVHGRRASCFSSPAFPGVSGLLTDEEHAAVTAAIRRAVEDDKFPRAPLLDPLRSALAKFDPAAAPELAARRIFFLL
jgi:hypothetical protein